MKFSRRIIMVSFMSVLSCLSMNANDGTLQTKNSEEQTIVQYIGRLQVKGSTIVGQQGASVALHGMSLFWSQWGGSFYNADCIRWLRDDWKCTVVRAVCGIRSDGYLGNPEAERAKIERVIDACIDLGIYVVVDWHDHSAENHLQLSKEFFRTIAQKYGSFPPITVFRAHPAATPLPAVKALPHMGLFACWSATPQALSTGLRGSPQTGRLSSNSASR